MQNLRSSSGACDSSGVDRPLIARLRGTLWIVLGAFATLSVADLASAADSGVYAVRAASAAAILALLAASRADRLARHGLALVLLAALVVCVDVAAVSTVKRDLGTATVPGATSKPSAAICSTIPTYGASW